MRLFGPDVTTLLDRSEWLVHAATSYGRCPDGTGDFAATSGVTRGGPNESGDGLGTSVWPGGPTAASADVANGWGAGKVLHFADGTGDVDAEGVALTGSGAAGVEGIAWLPNEFLLSGGFLDEAQGGAYDPSVYPRHGDDLFFVWVEGSAMIYGYAL